MVSVPGETSPTTALNGRMIVASDLVVDHTFSEILFSEHFHKEFAPQTSSSRSMQEASLYKVLAWIGRRLWCWGF